MGKKDLKEINEEYREEVPGKGTTKAQTLICEYICVFGVKWDPCGWKKNDNTVNSDELERKEGGWLYTALAFTKER